MDEHLEHYCQRWRQHSEILKTQYLDRRACFSVLQQFNIETGCLVSTIGESHKDLYYILLQTLGDLIIGLEIANSNWNRENPHLWRLIAKSFAASVKEVPAIASNILRK